MQTDAARRNLAAVAVLIVPSTRSVCTENVPGCRISPSSTRTKASAHLAGASIGSLSPVDIEPLVVGGGTGRLGLRGRTSVRLSTLGNPTKRVSDHCVDGLLPDHHLVSDRRREAGAFDDGPDSLGLVSCLVQAQAGHQRVECGFGHVTEQPVAHPCEGCGILGNNGPIALPKLARFSAQLSSDRVLSSITSSSHGSGDRKAIKVEMVALHIITGRHVIQAAGNGRLESEPAGLVEEGQPLVDK